MVLGALIKHWVEQVTGPWLYVVAGLMTFAETGTLLFVIPGEVTLILAGVAAGAGNLNLIVLLVVACVAAITGDAFGFFLGDRFGPRLKMSRLGRRLGEDSWRKTEDLIRRRRGLVVFFGRWIGFLRAIMPAAAGMSNMKYKEEFLPWDAAGAISWASLCVIGGYKLGDNAENLLKYIGWVAGAVAALGLVYFFGRRRLHKKIVG